MSPRVQKPAGAACAKCPARDAKLLAPASLVGAPAKRLVVIGESPWTGEFESGEIGSNERLLKSGLRAIGLRPEQIHWTNAVLCACAQKDQRKAAAACATRLRQEIAASQASLVVPLGSLGTAGAMGRKTAPHAKWRGSVTPSEAEELEAPGVGPVLVAPIVQPLQARRLERWKPVLESDVRRLGRVLQHGFRPPEAAPGREFLVARSLDQLEAGLERLGAVVSGDVETVGLGSTETRLVCLGFSDGTLTLVLPWSQANNGLDPYWMNPPLVARMLSAALRKRTLVTQNGPAFDHIVFARYGIEFDKWDDTLLAAHAMRSDLPKGLASLATTYLDVSAWKQAESRSAGLEELMRYNGADCLYTFLVWVEQRKKLKDAT